MPYNALQMRAVATFFVRHKIRNFATEDVSIIHADPDFLKEIKTGIGCTAFCLEETEGEALPEEMQSNNESRDGKIMVKGG